MIKKIFLTIGLILILITVFIIYLSLVGIETAKFNSFIKWIIDSVKNSCVYCISVFIGESPKPGRSII